MKIIAECGATKGDWRLIDDTGEIMQEHTCGINVSNMQTAAIKEIIDTVSSRFHGHAPEVTDIHIYVAGVMTEDIRTMVTGILSEKFPAAEMEFQHDLTAAARAACGHNPNRSHRRNRFQLMSVGRRENNSTVLLRRLHPGRRRKCRCSWKALHFRFSQRNRSRRNRQRLCFPLPVRL